MMALPEPPEDLCFSTGALIEKEFNVDEFVSEIRKRVTMKRLGEDLDTYYRALKNAMVELINKDYADFVALSANLVGMDKSINNLVTPLSQLQEEIMGIKQAMETAIAATNSKLARQAEIRQKKVMLRRLIDVIQSVEKLERLLKVSVPQDKGARASEIDILAQKEEFASMVMERVASEYNKLQYNVSHSSDHPLIDEMTPRIARITATLQNHLQDKFQSSLEHKDREGLIQSLQTYASINKQSAAEEMFQNVPVRPYMEQVISTKALLTHPQGLSGLLAEVLDFIPRHCSLLLEVTASGASGIHGYDFLVNAFWPVVVDVIDKKVAVIFAPGNPDAFHKNYTSSMEFLSSLEAQCVTQQSVKRLRAHPSYNAFMSKWSLPVYFQIRFQEIAGGLEEKLSQPLAEACADHKGAGGGNGDGGGDALSSSGGDRKSLPSPPFRLKLFHMLWRCISRCWQDGVFVQALVHRFWKLTLQLIVRAAHWLDELSDTQTSSPVDELSISNCLHIIHDCEEFVKLASVDDFIKPAYLSIEKLPGSAGKLKTLLKEGLDEAIKQLEHIVPKFAALIVDRVSHHCIHCLEAAQTIPRLYRRTNREAPSKPSNYVNNVMKPLDATSSDFPANKKKQWSSRIVDAVTTRYYEISSELLTSVKRTEDSLLKLKSYRKSLTPSTSDGISDDNKIRLQLSLDIEQYAALVATIEPEALQLPSFSQLLTMAQSAKATAMTSQSI